MKLFPGCKCGRCVRLKTLPPSSAVVMKSGNLDFLEPYGPPQACNGTAFTLKLYLGLSSVLFPSLHVAVFCSAMSSCWCSNILVNILFLRTSQSLTFREVSLILKHIWYNLADKCLLFETWFITRQCISALRIYTIQNTPLFSGPFIQNRSLVSTSDIRMVLCNSQWADK
jgi:hypothetical protein